MIIVKLFISVPSVVASTHLAVYTAESYTNELVSVSCTPSNTNYSILWVSEEGTPLWEVDNFYQFYPYGLNHTLTVLAPPDGIMIVLCGLRNPSGQPLLVNKQEISLITVTGLLMNTLSICILYITIGPVSIWNDNQQVLNNSIINVFECYMLSLRCLGVAGSNLQWNITGIPANSLTIEGSGNDVMLNYYNVTAGYYKCISDQGNQTVVFVATSKLILPFYYVAAFL